MLQTTAPRLDLREYHYWIAGPHEGLRLFLRRLSPAHPTASRPRPVLYVHGATFPSGLSIAHRFDGISWRDWLCAAGFDVWGPRFPMASATAIAIRDGRSACCAPCSVPYARRRRAARDGGALHRP